MLEIKTMVVFRENGGNDDGRRHRMACKMLVMFYFLAWVGVTQMI